MTGNCSGNKWNSSISVIRGTLSLTISNTIRIRLDNKEHKVRFQIFVILKKHSNCTRTDELKPIKSIT